MAAFVVELAIYYTDIIVIGHLGSLAFGAVGLAGSILWEATYVGFALLMVVSVVVAHGFGAGNAEEVGKGTRTGIVMALLMCGPWMLFAWFLPDLLLLTGQDPKVVAVGATYLHAVMWHLPATFLFMVLRQLVTGLSRPLVITAISAAAVPANLALNLILVFGAFGLPALGVAGSGISTSIVAWLKLAVMVAYIARQPELARFSPFRNLGSIDRGMWRQLWRLGLPVAGVRIIEGTATQATTVMMGLFGASALAAHNVMNGVFMLSGTLAVSFGHGAAVRVAQEAGGGRLAGALRAGWLAEVGVVVAVLPVAAALWLAPDLLTSIFLVVDDPANHATVVLAHQLRWVAGVFFVIQAIEVVVSRSLRGVKDMLVPMLMAAFGFLVVGAPLAWALAFRFGVGPVGLWLGMAVGFATTGSLMLVRWRRLGRRGR